MAAPKYSSVVLQYLLSSYFIYNFVLQALEKQKKGRIWSFALIVERQYKQESESAQETAASINKLQISWSRGT